MDELTRKVELQIIEHFGEKAQIIKAIEELSELIKELAKIINGQGDICSLAEEMADVHVMLTQLQIIFDIDEYVIERIFSEKINRTLKRIKRSEEGCKKRKV